MGRIIITKSEALEVIRSRNVFGCEFLAELMNDEEIVYGYSKILGLNFSKASIRLRNDREFVLRVLKVSSCAFLYIGDSLCNKDFILEAVKVNPDVLTFVSNKFKADKDIVLEAVRQKGGLLRHASAELKADKDVVLTAVKNNKNSLCWASYELMHNEEFLKEISFVPTIPVMSAC